MSRAQTNNTEDDYAGINFYEINDMDKYNIYDDCCIKITNSGTYYAENKIIELSQELTEAISNDEYIRICNQLTKKVLEMAK